MKRSGLLYGDQVCECAAQGCAEHTMAIGKMCQACQQGDHRKEGGLRTRKWYERLYGEEHASSTIENEREGGKR